MPKLTGGEALIHSLAREGISTVFGIPGLGQYEAVDALYMTPSIRYISLRNEQAASYMADGYARASGEIAAALLLPGPGVLNATGGMATAYAVSSPMLVITGTDHQREGWDDEREPPLLHALTKWVGRAKSVEEVPSLIHTAMQQLRHGRPRPVAVEVPHAVLAARQDVTLCEPATRQPASTDADLLDQAARWMGQAQRPLIWAGGGVHVAGAAAQITALAEAWRAPVMASRSGKGAISDRHPLSLGYGELRYPPLRRRFDESDLILAVGASLDFGGHHGRVIHVNADAAHAGGAADSQSAQDARRLGLVGDADAILDDLLARQAQFQTRAETELTALHAEIAALNEARFAPDQQLQPQAEIMRAVRNALPDDAVLAADTTQMGYYSRSFYPVYAPRAYFTCSRLWTLGAAFPLAMGAAVAQPERPSVALIGDGGFLYHAQELATAVKYDIPVIVALFNDHAYGNVLRAQEEEFDGHVIGTRLHNPDFIQLATSYGVWARRVHDAPALESALREAITNKKPALIEMPVGPMQRIF